jgi:putative heme iron utilization protein
VSAALLAQLLAAERHGVMATLSARRDGWPFASLAPYALTESGEPLLLLSDLAEHTRNVRVDARASLIVQDSSAVHDDPLAAPRATLLGTVEQLPPTDGRAAGQRYVERHPESAAYLSIADFHLYVLRVTEARFINGFGDMGWLSADRLSAALRRPEG